MTRLQVNESPARALETTTENKKKKTTLASPGLKAGGKEEENEGHLAKKTKEKKGSPDRWRRTYELGMSHIIDKKKPDEKKNIWGERGNSSGVNIKTSA